MVLHFVTPDAAGADVGDEVVLTGAEAHHAAAVRRLRVDEIVTIGDGAGVWLNGVCTAVSPREVSVQVTARTQHPAPTRRLVLVQALAKGDRDELAIQAATELGVDLIVPWQAERSVSRWDGKTDRALGRWRAIVREAAKQAHRAWIPGVAEPVTTTALAGSASGGGMLVLEPSASASLTGVTMPDAGDLVLVVGPEGGIAPGERRVLEAAGGRVVRLGDTVLRTSTAAVSAMSVANVLLGRW